MIKYSKKQIDQEAKPLKKYKRHQRVLWCVCDAVENRWRLVMVVLTKTGISSWSRLPACCDLKILVVWLCFHLMICECRIMPIVSVCVCVFANVCTCRLGTFVCVHVLMNTSLVVLCAHELVCKCIFAFQYPLMFSPLHTTCDLCMTLECDGNRRACGLVTAFVIFETRLKEHVLL